MQKSAVISGFLVGLFGGFALYHVFLIVGDFEVVSRLSLDQQRSRLSELEQDNSDLIDALFLARPSPYGILGDGDQPYDGDDDASDEVATARAAALAHKKFLMVTFGANWCQDCRSLHMNLHTKEVMQYTEGLFDFINVDVGKFNQNRHVAEALGVSLSRGIPVAVFFDPNGQVIGTTNEGELEPARRYSSRQILKFVRDIAERSRIQAPDAVH
jgi:thiol-disulfide isomerase/thioredoxin